MAAVISGPDSINRLLSLLCVLIDLQGDEVLSTLLPASFRNMVDILIICKFKTSSETTCFIKQHLFCSLQNIKPP